MVNFCDKCGERVKDEDLFCNSCGAQLSSSKTWIEPESSIKTQQMTSPSSRYQQTSTRPKRLYRSRNNRWISGVAGGLGEYFNIDPILVRIGFILMALMGWGTGVILYIILAIFVQENPYQNSPQRPPSY